jgi:hypothetical protein
MKSDTDALINPECMLRREMPDPLLLCVLYASDPPTGRHATAGTYAIVPPIDALGVRRSGPCHPALQAN